MMSLSEFLSTAEIETAKTAKKKKNQVKKKREKKKIIIICFLEQGEPVPRKGRV